MVRFFDAYVNPLPPPHPPLFLCVVQVLCGRQVFPEEQHDPVPDRLRGGADEGGLRSPGPLTLIGQHGGKGGGRGGVGEKERLKESLQSHNKKHYCLLSSSCLPHVHNEASLPGRGDTLLYRIAIETAVWQRKALEAYTRLLSMKKKVCPFVCL